ncbi:MAG: hypothetical protein TEF_09475 [Rhizobiales bacterium NRL2]|jgi:sulfide dehydrogenase cytochrome subunit|nr:MAG: hypothetical protein TEF_09475 [Rhizobiales bacterium NRL2]
MRLLLLGFVLSILTLTDHSQAQERSRGAVLALSCAGCHGTDGRSPGAMPALDGHDRDYIARAMREFRSGERPSTVMGRIATGYSDEEIALMAAHFDRLR